MRRQLPRGVALLACIGLISAGCQSLRVREVEEPLNETVLMVSRGANEAVLSWQTRPGYRYVVLHADNRSAASKWTPLPGAEMIAGTGKTATVRDVVPAGRSRFYRLEVIPPSGRKP